MSLASLLGWVPSNFLDTVYGLRPRLSSLHRQLRRANICCDLFKDTQLRQGCGNLNPHLTPKPLHVKSFSFFVLSIPLPSLGERLSSKAVKAKKGEGTALSRQTLPIGADMAQSSRGRRGLPSGCGRGRSQHPPPSSYPSKHRFFPYFPSGNSTVPSSTQSTGTEGSGRVGFSFTCTSPPSAVGDGVAS